MDLWKEGKIEELLFEGRSIQQRLFTIRRSTNQGTKLACSFSNLMFYRNTKATIWLVTCHWEQQGIGPVTWLHDVHMYHENPDSPTVLESLKKKHPPAQPCSINAILALTSIPPIVHSMIFEELDAQRICSAALWTTGSSGPSSTDAHCWRRLCSSFKRASDDLCHALALVAKKLCSTFVDLAGLVAFLACHLVTLDAFMLWLQFH